MLILVGATSLRERPRRDPLKRYDSRGYLNCAALVIWPESANASEIDSLIDKLVASGKAVLIVSSYFPELIGICDRIAVMHRGKLSAPRPVSEVDEHQLMMEACSGGRE